MKKDNGLLAICLIVLSTLSFLGWYTAEADNNILRKELSYYKNEEIRR